MKTKKNSLKKFRIFLVAVGWVVLVLEQSTYLLGENSLLGKKVKP